ncbi:MAG: putative toxin-antitoxin system toxin component, PIN family [Candidatus Omnitrophica bacterium]|nr:putative toxin-antitoxin system toxin component, PIN family [Candidatus Omnitrophota bacterium]
MNIVMDTNVVVSGLITPYGSAAEIVRMVAAGDMSVCYDARILSEYRQVLARPKFKLRPEAVAHVLAQVEAGGLLITPQPLPISLLDRDDEPFLAVAIAGQAMGLITGNKRHYPYAACQNIPVVSPAEFIEFYRRFKGKG